MANNCILLLVYSVSILVILNVSANSVERNNNYDETDPVMMLLNSEYDNDGLQPNENVNVKDNGDNERMIDGVPILYPDGVWKCGDCTNIDKMKLLYNEVHDQDIKYDDYVEEYLNVEIQIGLSLSNMRCITLEAEEEMDVRLVTGACTGEQVTFGIMRAAHCLISVYG